MLTGWGARRLACVDPLHVSDEPELGGVHSCPCLHPPLAYGDPLDLLKR